MELAARSVTAQEGHFRPRAQRRGTGPDRSRPVQVQVQVEIVVPVYNEAHQLAERITTLRAFLNDSLPFSSLVTIVDNGSTDGTALVARRMAATLGGVRAMILARKGRGYALRCAWEASSAEVVAYMDLDLSTSLTALMPLVATVLSGHGDVAVGSRLAPGSRVVRGPKRELISRAYSLLVRTSLRSHVRDYQCGFKALRRTRALELLPLVEDDSWFFDTELLVTAERLGLRVTEIPVDWVDDPDSRVDIVSTAKEDLKGIWRISHGSALRETRLRRIAERPETSATSDQLLSFAGVGLLSTLTYLFLFSLAWRGLGPWIANALALALCTLCNTALHRSLHRTRHESDAGWFAPPSSRREPSVVGVTAALFGVSLLATNAALLVLAAGGLHSLAAALVAVTLANGAASLLRFALLRGWAFRPSAPRR
jgi:glycosyltransferase involved in cell wall biosynthesis